MDVVLTTMRRATIAAALAMSACGGRASPPGWPKPTEELNAEAFDLRFRHALAATPENPEALLDPPSADLVASLRPGGASTTGFISPDDDLAEVIRFDDVRVRLRGSSHRLIAAWLHALTNPRVLHMGVYRVSTSTSPASPRVPIWVTRICYKGIQRSPFRPSVWWECDSYLSGATGTWIRVSDGHPHLIGDFGFYEGNVPYRSCPDHLIDLMEGKPLSPSSPQNRCVAPGVGSTDPHH